MSVLRDEDAKPDFDAAGIYLKLAREAHDRGDAMNFVASRKLLLVALCIPDAPPMRAAKAA